MNYALVENGVVTNLIWLSPANENEFPGAVPVGNRPVAVGDAYENGRFTRNGEPVLTGEEAEIAALDAAVIDLTYENILAELGVNE